MKTFVVDASVAARVVLQEQDAQASDQFLKAAADAHWQLVAPDFWLLECGNACRKRVARGTLERGDALMAYQHFKRLPVKRINTGHLSDHAANLALAFNITTYDALYVATAQYVGGTLVTADARLVDALRPTELALRVSHVAELPE